MISPRVFYPGSEICLTAPLRTTIHPRAGLATCPANWTVNFSLLEAF
jgi:hypothetical protein